MSDSRLLYQFTQGIDLDQRLAAQEVKVQTAWAKALCKAGILKESEAASLGAALESALELIQKNEFEWKVEHEDIHMHLEQFLTSKLGELGKRIHLGRSRNDLIATTLRLFVADTATLLMNQINKLIEAIHSRSEQWIDVLIPGMTHLQSGQPIRLGSAFSAHGWMLARDLKRLKFVRDQALESMPLGSAALAGTTIDIDLLELAKDLGFASPSNNSYDSVGDRDFMLDALSAYAILGVHLSRLAEDTIIFSSTLVGLLKLPAAWSTGSSIMPNKRNPDVAELVRAKAAQLMGANAQGLALMKGLPLSYVSDLHELKRVLLSSFDQATSSLEILPFFISGLEVNHEKAKQLLESGHILATDVANTMTEQGVPFRDAYRTVAKRVAEADERGISIEAISPELKSTESSVGPYFTAVEKRKSQGGTAKKSVQNSLSTLLAQRQY